MAPRDTRSRHSDSAASPRPGPAARGQALGMRWITRAGGLGPLRRPAVRARVSRILYRTARGGFSAQQTVARRAFAAPAGTGSPQRPRPTTPRGQFDLTPTPDQAMIRDAAGQLADQVLRPAAADADTARRVPPEVREQAAAMGLTQLAVPSRFGGIAEERSAVTGALVLEELGYGDLGLAAAVMAPAAVAGALAGYGTAAQQQRYLPAFTEEASPATGCLALMEPGPLADPLRPAATARRDGDQLVLDGVKALAADPGSADLLIVSASLDGRARLVIVEPGTSGVTVSDDPGMGLRAARTGTLHLRGARVPATNLLGSCDDHLDAVRRSRLAWSAAAVGTCRAVLDQVREYALTRTAFGDPIGYRQAVAFAVADIAIELDALRLVVWRAAALLDAGKDAGEQIAHARSLTARYATRTGSQGVQLLGGHGFIKDFPNERWYRDLRAAGMLEGTLLV